MHDAAIEVVVPAAAPLHLPAHLNVRTVEGEVVRATGGGAYAEAGSATVVLQNPAGAGGVRSRAAADVPASANRDIPVHGKVRERSLIKVNVCRCNRSSVR